MKLPAAFVLDCSVTMTWLFAEEATHGTLAIRDQLLQTYTYAPSIWPLEVNNVLWVAIRKKKISELQAKRFKFLLNQLPIRIDLKASDLMNDVILELAKTYQLSCYDAAYLELALREKVALATLDKDLIKAAQKMGIQTLPS